MLLLIGLRICTAFDLICDNGPDIDICYVNGFRDGFKLNDEELNFPKNTESFKNSKFELRFRESILKKVPAGIFKDFKNLKKLDMWHCELQQIDVNTFIEANKLEILILELNKISHFENSTFNGAENLQQLDLSNNGIEQLPNGLFTKLIKLNNLDLGYNKLEILDETLFSSLRQLTKLNLEENKLTVISPDLFSKNYKISFLDLRNNQLTDVEVAIQHLNKLKVIFLSRNNLTKLNNYPESINELYINQNQLKKLIINKNIIELNAQNNEISEISANFVYKIETLRLAGNKLWSIEDIEKLKEAEPLNLNAKPLKQISERFFEKNSFFIYLCILTKDLMPNCRKFVSRNYKFSGSISENLYDECLLEFFRIIHY